MRLVVALFYICNIAVGLEVGRLAQHMNQEKANISGELEGLSYLPELQQKMSSLVRETENKKNEKNELEQEIRRLERDYFREVDHCRQIGDAKDRLLRESQCLERALEDIKKSNEKMR
ncbi:unnamed protein product [Calicophoron daubneyi]|uniref:Uncharacterized protein n=1 Tax=Calicophoron daubneyi TaxID=300641 RepID=A0AAV2TL25_CALDB